MLPFDVWITIFAEPLTFEFKERVYEAESLSASRTEICQICSVSSVNGLSLGALLKSLVTNSRMATLRIEDGKSVLVSKPGDRRDEGPGIAGFSPVDRGLKQVGVILSNGLSVRVLLYPIRHDNRS